MKKINLLFLIALSLLTGCVSINQHELDQVARGEKAIVVSRCIASLPPTGLIFKDYDDEPCLTTWKKYLGKDAISGELYGEDILLGELSHEKYNIKVINPGIYVLNSFYAQKRDSDYKKEYYSNKLNGIAFFSVRGGEWIYIGDLRFNIRKSAIVANAISVSNSEQLVRQFFVKNYPLNTLDTRLTNLSPTILRIQKSDGIINRNFKNN